MKIDRNRVKLAFRNFLKQYDTDDAKIRLKIEHSYKVAELCENIAHLNQCKKEEVEIAWLMGLLHDIGRFEQLRKYGTFDDRISVNHGELGVYILFHQERIRDFIEESNDDEILQNVIRYHNAFSVPLDLSEQTMMLCNILRDADKIDILRVNSTTPLEEIYMIQKEKFLTETVSEDVMNNYKIEIPIDRESIKTSVDHIVSQIALAFGLVYQVSIQIIYEQGYLERMLKYTTMNPKTEEQFKIIRGIMYHYLVRRMNDRFMNKKRK